jgi:hypothetical protein
VQGTLGKIKLNVQIDFGFGDVVVPQPVLTELPQLLDLGAPRLLGYTPESAIAEKFQAMIALDIANTRIKDFYDIWSLVGCASSTAKRWLPLSRRRSTGARLHCPKVSR